MPRWDSQRAGLARHSQRAAIQAENERSELVSGYTGWIFAIFSPYESALRADDGSVPYFLICQGTFQWQPNNFSIIKAN